MRRILKFPVLFILLTGILFFTGFKTGYGQIVESLKVSNMLPSYLEGFEVDRPIVVVDQNRDNDYISVSRIFYRPDNEEAITVTFKDYSINPASYQKRIDRLKKLEGNSDTVTVSRYKGNLMNTERRINYIEKGIYLGQNKAVEVVHEGAISDTSLSTTLLNRLDLNLIKKKL